MERLGTSDYRRAPKPVRRALGERMVEVLRSADGVGVRDVSDERFNGFRCQFDLRNTSTLERDRQATASSSRNNGFNGRNVNFETGEPDSNGNPVRHSTFAATVLELVGVDPEPYLPSVTPLAALHA